MRAGVAIDAEHIAETGEFPVYGANGRRGYTSRATHTGTVVLVGRQGALCGNVRVVRGAYWVSEHAIVCTPDPGVEPRWLAYLLQVMNLGQYSTSAAQPGIGVAQIRQLGVYVPDPAEQASIADFLDQELAQIDALIAEQERFVGLLVERRRALVDRMADAVVGPAIRLRYLYRPSSEADHPLEAVLSVYREHGVVPKTSRADNHNRTPEDLSRYLLVLPGDLVVNRMKAWQGSLGTSEHRGIVSGDYEVLRPMDDRLEPRFAHFLLRSQRMIGEYRARSTGIRPAQWRLYWEQMADIRVPLPPHAEQVKIARRLDVETSRVDALVEKTLSHVALAKERRAALITAAVTGQIDVTRKVS